MKHNLSSFILLLAFCHLAKAQVDSSLVKKLNRPINNCEIVAHNSQILLTQFKIKQSDSINKVLAVWRQYCGANEPISRITILTSIYFQNNNDSINAPYLDNYLHKYKYRIKAAAEYKLHDIYENNKGYLDYIPLKGEFDYWTKNIALELLPNQQPGTSEHLLCLLFSNNFELFDKELQSHKSKNSFVSKYERERRFNNWNRGITLTLVSGIWSPAGKLANTFKQSPQFGFLVGAPISKSLRIDLGLVLAVLESRTNFDLYVENSIKSARGKYCVTFGGWVTKEIKVKKFLFLDLIGGLALGKIDTDLNKPRVNQNNNTSNDYYYGVSTIDSSIGVSIRKKIFRKSSIGISYNLHYVPYSLDDILVTDLGDHFSSTSLIYRF